MTLREIPLPLRMVGLWAAAVGILFVAFLLAFPVLLFGVIGEMEREGRRHPLATPLLARSQGDRVHLIANTVQRRSRSKHREIRVYSPSIEAPGRLDLLSSREAPEGEPLALDDAFLFFSRSAVTRVDAAGAESRDLFSAPSGAVRPFRLSKNRILLLGGSARSPRVARVDLGESNPYRALAWETAPPGVRNARNFYLAEAGGKIRVIEDDRANDAVHVDDVEVPGCLRHLLYVEGGTVLLVERCEENRIYAIRLGDSGLEPGRPFAPDSGSVLPFVHEDGLASLRLAARDAHWSPDAFRAPPARPRRSFREVWSRPEFRALLPVFLLPVLLLLLLPFLALIFARIADRWIEAENPPPPPIPGARRAPLRKRTLALLADAIVTTTPGLLLVAAFLAVLATSLDGLRPNDPPPPQFIAALLLGIPAMILFGWGFPILYGGICESRYGRTIGKRLVGIRVVAASGAPPRLLPALLRALLKLLDQSFYCLSAVILVGMTPPGRTLADLAADTYVIEDPPAA